MPLVSPLVTPFSGMQFADPWAFALLVVVAAEAMRVWLRRAGAPAAFLGFPGVSFLDGEPATGRVRWLRLPPVMRTLGLTLVVVALARPRADGLRHDTPVRGRNIVLTLDISSSMKALDFRTGNRIEVAKRVLGDFVARRRGDFLGLVVFAGRAFTQAPLTTDADVVLELLHRADIGMLPDGTAIGTALAMSESHLEDLPRESGVIVLLTDGGNNTGYPDPLAAAEAARALGIRIYAIGVSSRGATPIAPYETGRPATMEGPSTLTSHEEQVLGRIASISNGKYFRVSDDSALVRVLGEIDRLERTDRHLSEVVSYHEYFVIPLIAAVLLIAGEMVLRATWLRVLP
jgi:Ca-activated chloride channel family protein